jgi:hypothetical protein
VGGAAMVMVGVGCGVVRLVAGGMVELDCSDEVRARQRSDRRDNHFGEWWGGRVGT